MFAGAIKLTLTGCAVWEWWCQSGQSCHQIWKAEKQQWSQSDYDHVACGHMDWKDTNPCMQTICISSSWQTNMSDGKVASSNPKTSFIHWANTMVTHLATQPQIYESWFMEVHAMMVRPPRHNQLLQQCLCCYQLHKTTENVTRLHQI